MSQNPPAISEPIDPVAAGLKAGSEASVPLTREEIATLDENFVAAHTAAYGDRESFRRASPDNLPFFIVSTVHEQGISLEKVMQHFDLSDEEIAEWKQEAADLAEGDEDSDEDNEEGGANT